MTTRANELLIEAVARGRRAFGTLRCFAAALVCLTACDSTRLCKDGDCPVPQGSDASVTGASLDAASPDVTTTRRDGGGTPASAEVSAEAGSSAAPAPTRDCSADVPCPGSEVCHPELHVCVACLSSEQCSAPRPFCLVRQDPTANECTGCLGDEDCGELRCFSGVCGRCDVVSGQGCEAPRAQCVAVDDAAGTRCVECSDSSDCADPDRPACDVASGTCFACLADGTGCAEGQRCLSEEPSDDAGLPPAPRCVECTADNVRLDCGADRPFCIEERCVECDPDTGSGCGLSPRPFCRTGAELAAESSDPESLLVDGELPVALCVACETDDNCTASGPYCIAGACSECRQDADCLDPTASRCDGATHRCVPCAVSDECEHIPGAPVCHVDASADAGGGAARCVECDALDYRACDNAKNACVTTAGSDQFTCSTTRVNSLGRCLECSSDAACSLGQRCVDDGSGQPRCLYFTGGIDGATSCTDPEVEPFIQPLSAISVDGAAGTYCTLDTTTCDVFLHFKELCQDDDECGDPGEGAFCFPVPSEGQKRCSYTCGGNIDCPSPTRTCANGHCSPL